MAGFLKRFGRGAVAGGEGATGGLLQHLLMQREQERFEGEQAETQKTDALKRLLMQAQIGEIGREEPEKPLTLPQAKAKLYQEDPEEYIRRERAVSGKGEAKPALTLKDVITAGGQAEDDARQILNKLRGQDLSFTQELENLEAKRKGGERPHEVLEPPTFEDISALGDTLQFRKLGVPSEQISTMGGKPQDILDFLTSGKISEQTQAGEKPAPTEAAAEPETITVQELADSLRQAKDAGNEIIWDKVAETYPDADIEQLKQMVGE